jgi:hypothetical protein
MIQKLLNLLNKQIEFCLKENDIKSAFQAYNLIDKWLNDQNIKNKDKVFYNKINNYLYKLKFISLNYYEDAEIINLLKYYFPFIFELPGYDLWDKLKVHLVSISSIDERNEFKSNIMAALNNCDAYLIPIGKYKDSKMVYKVNDWLKEFFINIDKNLSNTIKEAEYLSNNSLIKQLKPEDKVKILTLLELYKKLNSPSHTKEGQESSIILDIDGKKYVFSQGQLEKLPKLDLSDFGIEEEKPIENRLIEKVTAKKSDKKNNFHEKDFEEEIKIQYNNKQEEGKKNLAELQTILNEYPLTSLEYKAVKQEINRLKDKNKHNGK